MTFLFLLPLSNMFHCLCHVLLYLKHPNKSFLTQQIYLTLLHTLLQQELEQTQIKNVGMFTQNAWITFTSFFVPGLFLTTWFFLLPFNPIGISIVAVLNIASTAVIFVALRKKYPSPIHMSRIDIRKKMKVIKKK